MNSKRMEIPEDQKVCISSTLWLDPEPALFPTLSVAHLQTVCTHAVWRACDLLAQFAGGIYAFCRAVYA